MKFFLRLFTLCLLVLGGVGVMRATHAASLGISSSNNALKIGDTFSVRAFVSSSDQAINAVSGVVSASKETLEILSVDLAGSIVRLWTRDPVAQKNQVSFEGVVLNPGFKGSVGRIFTIRLRAKAVGQGTVLFQSGTVLANDGKGTRLPVSLGDAHFQITKSEEQKPSTTSAETIKKEESTKKDPWISTSSTLTPFYILETIPGIVIPSSSQPESPREVLRPVRGGWTAPVSGWWAGLAALFVPTAVGLAHLGGVRFGFIAALRRRRKVRTMQNRIFQLLLQWDENLDRQHTRLKRAAKHRDLTVVEKQTLRDIQKNQIRMHELGDLITELPASKKSSSSK